MELLTCSICGFEETETDTFLETSIVMENEDGDEYDVFCLECPKCGHLTGHEF